MGKMVNELEIYDIIKTEEGERKKTKIHFNVIASNFEKYIAFNSGRHLHFIDSLAFMSQSLDKLSSNLPEESVIYTHAEKKARCKKI